MHLPSGRSVSARGHAPKRGRSPLPVPNRLSWPIVGGGIVAASLIFFAFEARRLAISEEATRGLAMAPAGAEAIAEFALPIGSFEELESSRSKPSEETASDRYGAGLESGTRAAHHERNIAGEPLPSASMGSGSVAQLAGPEMTPSRHEAPNAKPSSPGSGIAASRLPNPSTTIVQGTLINAVLETAVDTAHPGLARAIVTFDVHGFDGRRVLIDRGSRLYGHYDVVLGPGEDRAQIRWTRLVRPDGVTVALDSPTSDPLGRAGLKGKVDNHLLERFGNAIVGRASALGQALASSSSPVLVAGDSGGAVGAGGQGGEGAAIAPTLTVRQGTRIAILVEYDLDFTKVERPD